MYILVRGRKSLEDLIGRKKEGVKGEREKGGDNKGFWAYTNGRLAGASREKEVGGR